MGGGWGGGEGEADLAGVKARDLTAHAGNQTTDVDSR